MHGNEEVAVGEIHRHHDEVRTINRNSLYSLDYSSDKNWGMSVQLPMLSRDHTHVHNHHGEQITEDWGYNEVGDVRMLGRYGMASKSMGLIAGLKLPTGDTKITNAEGELAERTLQPGTGTTDGIVGAYYRHPFHGSNHSWFSQALFQIAASDHNDFRPGNSTTLDVGYRYAMTDKLGLLAQTNLLIKGEDKGAEAEPEDSGGRYLFLSPGVSYQVGDSMQLYGFMQLPVARFVNGVQLNADYSLSAGVSVRF